MLKLEAENENALYRKCVDFVSRHEYKLEEERRKELKAKMDKIPLGFQFRSYVKSTVYTVYKKSNGYVHFNWQSDKEGTSYHIDEMLRLLNNKTWIEV